MTAQLTTAGSGSTAAGLPSYRHLVGQLGDIPIGEGRAFAVQGEQVAVFRLREGGLRAVQAVCPHRAGPLADGQIDESVVVCPLHANLFDLATGCSLSGQPPLRTYDVGVTENGAIWVAARESTR